MGRLKSKQQIFNKHTETPCCLWLRLRLRMNLMLFMLKSTCVQISAQPITIIGLLESMGRGQKFKKKCAHHIADQK